MFISRNILFLFFLSFPLLSDISVKTSSGLVKSKNINGVLIWEDIPYAKPPLGELRWKAPRKFKDHSLIITPKDNNFCIQKTSSLGGSAEFSEKDISGSEDCLYLDIFGPAKKNEEFLPVMFWIHGGGNTSGLKDIYDFSKLARKHKIIIVRINYRLGPFGWFSHPAIQNFNEGIDKTSNFGTLDIIGALEWVKDNISLFGGDAQNITVFGESAGGHNIYSLMVAPQAKNLFHKAIIMSGYTTSISVLDAYKPSNKSSTSEYSSSRVLNKLIENLEVESTTNIDDGMMRRILMNVSAEDFFNIYAERNSYEEIPLLTADGIVIPKVGLKKALSMEEHLNVVPTIAGSNRDEVKLWLATAKYFVDLDFSVLGSILKIPKVRLSNEDSFEAFNYYRSSAWKIRGVDDPLRSLSFAGNDTLYAYRYDWDDHRRFIIADFQKLIGAAHATEIPLLAGNTDLVGGYPLSDLIYPPSFSKRFTSKNMMKFWANFARFGSPGKSTNSVLWEPYEANAMYSNYLILDKKRNLKMHKDSISMESLTLELENDKRVNDLERCVLLMQIFTYIGEDLYDELIKNTSQNCSREESQRFVEENASYIEY